MRNTELVCSLTVAPTDRKNDQEFEKTVRILDKQELGRDTSKKELNSSLRTGSTQGKCTVGDQMTEQVLLPYQTTSFGGPGHGRTNQD